MYEAWLHGSKEAMDYQIALILEPCSRSRFFSDWCRGSVGYMAKYDIEEIMVKKPFFMLQNLNEIMYKEKSNFLGTFQNVQCTHNFLDLLVLEETVLTKLIS